MIDRREKILGRIFEIVQSTAGITAAYRNNPDPSEGAFPSAVVLDGDEELAQIPDQTRNRGAGAPVFMTMRSEIWILLSGDQDEAGALLNELRGRLYKAIVTDAPLLALIEAADRSGAGRILLQATRTDFAFGRMMQAEMVLEFAITYVLRASDL
jgi:hypothetical protein